MQRGLDSGFLEIDGMEMVDEPVMLTCIHGLRKVVQVLPCLSYASLRRAKQSLSLTTWSTFLRKMRFMFLMLKTRELCGGEVGVDSDLKVVLGIAASSCHVRNGSSQPLSSPCL